MSKKAKPIKAEEYKDEEEIAEEEIYEDDYYEDENEQVEEDVEEVEESPKTFKVKEENQQDEDDYEEASKTFRRVNSSKFMKIFNVFLRSAGSWREQPVRQSLPSSIFTAVRISGASSAPSGTFAPASSISFPCPVVTMTAVLTPAAMPAAASSGRSPII